MDDATTNTQDAEPDRAQQRRHALESRHAQALTRLMDERTDLRGVHALADLVSDSLRWSA